MKIFVLKETFLKETRTLIFLIYRDGKTNGITVPNADAHVAVIRQAYVSAGLDPLDTAMVEAHGTGTKMGDPLEAKAIGECFRQNGVYLGAVSED